MVRKHRMTASTRAVLAAFMQDPVAEQYGLTLAQATGLSSGTLYPILARLEDAGLLTSRWEDINEGAEGRPRRRYYRLTPSGRDQAPQAIADGTRMARLILGQA